jgi:YD repeat-containing protein
MKNSTVSEIADAWVSGLNSAAADCHNGTNPNNRYEFDKVVGNVMYFNCYSWDDCGGVSIDNFSTALTPVQVIDVNKRQELPKSCPVGDPFYPTLGVRHEDLDTGVSLGRLSVRLSYDTAAKAPFAASSASAPLPSDPSAAILGDAWSLSLVRKLVLQGVAAAPGALMWRGDGRAMSLSVASSGGLANNSGVIDKLVKSASGYIFYDFDQNAEESYDANGNLTAVYWANGESATFSSTAPSIGNIAGLSVLNSVQDAFGRAITLAYDPVTGRLSTLQDPAGNSVAANFAAGMFSGVTWPDASVKTYLYENAAYPWAMTGVVDEQGQRFATFGYDANGVAVSTQQAGGAGQYVATWTSAPAISVTDVYDSLNSVTYRYHYWVAPGGLSYTDPKGIANSLTTTTVLGATYVASQGQPPGSGCLASVSTNQYDASGNVTTSTDFNGNRTCYAYDTSRNLRTLTLEGLPSSGSCPVPLSPVTPAPVDAAHPERMTTTVWHPDWVLKTREAVPQKLTTWVYNGQPDPIKGGTASCVSPATTLPDGKPLAVLCARYEQATTDATGALGLSATVTGATRAWTYTYNAYGQVLTATDPKLSSTDAASHTTTYAYYATTALSGGVGHTMGDLQTLTTPLGQVTTYTSYDAAGRLLSSTDPNGTVTANTYWPRGWLHTQTVTPTSGSAQTTTYAYYPTGLLQTATLPDGTQLTYAYDTAHRLTDVTDGAGNTAHYTLDASGNRTGEQVKDGSGVLAGAIARVFDNLNRVQSVTGAVQ